MNASDRDESTFMVLRRDAHVLRITHAEMILRLLQRFSAVLANAVATTPHGPYEPSTPE
ncbi:hypothetical protein [Mycobacterium sp. 360MFTsu5.1]|uniref:hypothetical protein n=1 Tax=Mycobacterium sp. 360MFTsu5.1 TaxID=1172186 RepID=UPI0003613925|nr:hypothetical protein [Mycobacterium sp. 360MFTsu5.1]